MTRLNWLRYQHLRFWDQLLKVFPLYRDAMKQANRWCFVEMQVEGIDPPEGPFPWLVIYKAGGRIYQEEGNTLIEAMERAMDHAEGVERGAKNPGAAGQVSQSSAGARRAVSAVGPVGPGPINADGAISKSGDREVADQPGETSGAAGICTNASHSSVAEHQCTRLEDAGSIPADRPFNKVTP